MVQHVVEESDLSLLVANDGELQVCTRDLVDVLDPATMAFDGVGRQADELDASSGEFRFEFGESTELGGTDWSVVFWMGEKDDPVVADELVEIDVAGGGLSLEIGGNGAKSKASSQCQQLFLKPGKHIVNESTYGSGLPAIVIS